MAKNLKEFVKNNNTIHNEDEAVIKNKVNNYKNMSESQLMMEMQKVANENKQKGNLSASDLQTFYNNVSPMLTDAQRNKMKQLINSLK